MRLVDVGLATEVEHLGVLRIRDLGDRDGLPMDIQADVVCYSVSWLTSR